jgi:hypothetical protein
VSTTTNGRTTHERPNNIEGFDGLMKCAILAAMSLSISAGAAFAQLPLPSTQTTPSSCTPFTQTQLIEWDVLAPDGFVFTDATPGAMIVDHASSRQSRVWFVTRLGSTSTTSPNDGTRLYRLTPGRGIKKDPAEAKSWPIGTDLTGGVRLRHSGDGRFVFVNTQFFDNPNAALVMVDTRDDKRTTWFDRPANPEQHISDVAVDTRGGANTIFTAALAFNDFMGTDGVVQRLRPGQPRYNSDGTVTVPAEVTRWRVGGRAGDCEDTGIGAPCIPGIAVDRRHGHPVFFSEPGRTITNSYGQVVSVGAVGELDPRLVKCPWNPYKMCSKVRHWPLPPRLAPEPTSDTSAARQLLVDEDGKVWGITSEGELFSLEVDRSYDKGILTKHNAPGAMEDFFAVAPDSAIGYTDSQNDEVSVLFPIEIQQKVKPVVEFVEAETRNIDGIRVAAPNEMHEVMPRKQQATGVITEQDDGTYVETNLASAMPTSMSSLPTGMFIDPARKTGSFFFSIGTPSGIEFQRVAHLEVKIEEERELDNRRDDDDCDDDGVDDQYDADDDDDGVADPDDPDDDNDCIPDMMDTDKDGDGIENEYDSPSYRENKKTDSGQMTAGQVIAYETLADANTQLVLATVRATDVTTPLSIEIVDPNGVVVVSTPPAVGVATASATPLLQGVYTVRVRNNALTSRTYKTTIISKQIWF